MEQNVFQSVSRFLSRVDLRSRGSGIAIQNILSQLETTGQKQQTVEDKLLEIAHAMKRYKDQLRYQLEVDEDYRTIQIGLLDQVRPLLLGVRFIEWETWRSEMGSQRALIITLAQSLNSPNTLQVNALGDTELRTLYTDLLADVNALIDTIREADIDVELKQVLYNALNFVRRAIENYDITGTEGLVQAMQDSTLFFSRYRDAFDSSEAEIDQDVIKETLGILERVVTIVKTAWPKSIDESSLLALPAIIDQMTKLP